MSFRIIEKFTTSKSGKNDGTNEDRIVITDNFAAVIDGATSKEKTGGTAAELVAQTIKILKPNTPAQEAVKIIQNSLKNQIGSASALIYSNSRKELWSIGDCRYSLNGETHKQEKKIDIINAEIRSAKAHELISQGMTIEQLRENDLSREAIMPNLIKQKELENSAEELGYPVLNGKNEDVKVKIIKIPAASTLILASDGYPVIEDTLKKSEAALKKMIIEDPLCISVNKGTKGVKAENESYDDRTYVKIIT